MKKTKEKEKVETETTDSEEEETKPDTEAEGSEEETEEETEEEETEVESEEEEDSNVDIDYKAEAKREREAREKAEEAAADTAFKLREEKRKRKEAEAEEADDDDDDEDEKPLTRKELDTILDKDRKEQTMSKAIEIATNISGSDDEAELVMEVYKSRTFPAHLTLEQKLQEAYLIANAPKIIGQNAELKRALKGKGLSSKDVAGTHHDKPKAGEPKLSDADKTVLTQVGFNWNGTSKRYEKKLANGQTLVREKNREGKWITRPLST